MYVYIYMYICIYIVYIHYTINPGLESGNLCSKKCLEI